MFSLAAKVGEGVVFMVSVDRAIVGVYGLWFMVYGLGFRL
jgi:hypothetical protein